MRATVSPNNQSKALAGCRHRAKPVRRAVVVQCDQCEVIGTGATKNGRLIGVNLPATRTTTQFTHTCGGAFVPYDIEAEA